MFSVKKNNNTTVGKVLNLAVVLILCLEIISTITNYTIASQYYSSYNTLRFVRSECVFVILLSLIIIALSIVLFLTMKKQNFQNGLGVVLSFFFPYAYQLFIFFRNSVNGYSVSDYIESMSDLLQYSRLLLIIPIVLTIVFFKHPSRNMKTVSLVSTIILGLLLIIPETLSSITNFIRFLSGYYGFFFYNCLSAILTFIYIISIVLMIIQISNSFSFVSETSSNSSNAIKDQSVENQALSNDFSNDESSL